MSAFVRALDSKEIFVSPLSYGVVPFTANIEKRRLKIDLANALRKRNPANRCTSVTRPIVRARSSFSRSIKEFLQVTDYKTPDPLRISFRKCALGVETAQIVDLIIPEFSLLRSLSAFGGDGEGAAKIQSVQARHRKTGRVLVRRHRCRRDRA